MNTATIDFVKLWEDAIPYARFVAESTKNCALWEGVYRTAKVPDWAVADACDRGKQIKLLAIAEDWCGDASNTVPILAKLGDAARCLDMRVLRRDEHPEAMDRYLTNGGRAIPIVIALNEQFDELGHWGPRPAELQAWIMEHKDTMESAERYRYARRWYAKDKGETTMREVLALLPS